MQQEHLKNDILYIIGALLVVVLIYIINSYKSLSFEVATNEHTNTFENIFTNSSYFKEKNIISLGNKVVIDNDYEVSLKDDIYTIKQGENKDITCQIVDAIYVSFGKRLGESISACKMVLDGLISMNGLNVNFTNNLLTVSTKGLPTFYNNTHKEGEFISSDEINYIVVIDNLYLSNLKIKETSICGNIYNQDKMDSELTFKFYNENKEYLQEVPYIYRHLEDHYIPFCLEFKSVSNLKYYSTQKVYKNL